MARGAEVGVKGQRGREETLSAFLINELVFPWYNYPFIVFW